MNIQVQQIAKLTGHNAAVYTLVPGQEAHQFLSGGGEGWVVAWNLNDPENGRLLAQVESNIFSLCYIAERNLLLAGNMYGGLHWVDLNNKTDLKNVAYHQKGIFDIQYVNGHIYTAGGDGKLVKWSIENQQPLETLELASDSLRSITYQSERKEWAIGASDNAIYILNEDWEIKKRLTNAHENSVFNVQYSPDRKYLLSGGRDAHLRVWSVEQEFSLLVEHPAHWFTVNHLAYHPDGHIFATASRDKTIKIWNAVTFDLLKVIDATRYGGHINSVNRLLWSSHHNYLISCSDDRTIIVWDIDIEN